MIIREKTTLPATHARASQRRHYRITAPLQVTWDGRNFETHDWGVGGLRLKGFGDPVAVGSRQHVTIAIPFQDFHISFELETVVVRSDPETSQLALEFVAIDDRQRELLEHFVKSILTGQMASVGGMVKRLDTPVTTVAGLPDDGVLVPRRRQRVRRYAIAGGYLLLGTALTGLILFTLYSRLFRLQVESAVVSAPIEAITSPLTGTFAELFVEPQQSVSAGDPILRIENSETTQELELAEIGLMEVQLRLAGLEGDLRNQRQKLDLYGQIGANRVRAAEARLSALVKEKEIALANLQRNQSLHEADLIALTTLEDAERAYQSRSDELAVAEAELAIEQDAVDAVSEGRFFTGNKLEGEVPELESDVEVGRQEVALAERRLEVARRRHGTATIQAPFDGRIVRVLKSIGNTVDRGDPLVLQEKPEVRTVDAYLTQDEVTQVGLGDRGTVFVPATGARYPARVLQVDRTTGFLDEMQAQFRWRGSQDRSARVVLQLEDRKGQPIQHDLPSGLPVVVSLHRESRNAFVSRLVSLFGGGRSP